MDDRKVLVNLRDILAKLYADELSARRIVHDAGLNSRQIHFNTTAINIWHAIITEAINVGRFSNVMRAVFAEYGTNRELFDAYEAYRNVQTNRVERIRSQLDNPKILRAKEIGIEWISIPEGEFLYGDEKKLVHLDEFYISKTPITNMQYKVFLDVTGYKKAPSYWENDLLPAGKEKHPVTRVCRFEAEAFCQWAGVRLPTEVEWEKACRGTDGRTYPWGNQPFANQYGNIGKGVSGDTTSVGIYLEGASPYGVLDMAGNVWEWCANIFPHKRFIDGVLRGGSFFNRASYATCTSRWITGIDIDNHHFGFRVAFSA